MQRAVVLLLALVGSLGAGSARAAAEQRPVAIDGPRIRVADLIKGYQGSVDLGAAPAPGQTRRVERHRLEPFVGKRARRLPEYFIVKTRSRQLDCSEFQRMVTAQLSTQIASGLAVRQVDCRRSIIVPRGKPSLEVSIADRSRRAGRLPALVTLRVDQWAPQRISTTVEIDGELEVLVATRDARMDEVAVAVDFRLERRQASTVPNDAVTRLAELNGSRLSGPLRDGDVLRRSRLRPIPVVRKGAMVSIVVVLNGVRVTNRGIARIDGGLGDVVPVLATGSLTVLKGRVVGPQRIRVDL